MFGSDLNSVQLCPPGAAECELDDMAHEPERASLAHSVDMVMGWQLAALPDLPYSAQREVLCCDCDAGRPRCLASWVSVRFVQSNLTLFVEQKLP